MTNQASEVLQGDCLERLKAMPDDYIDAVITDPPYGYSFMGKDWDKAVPSVDIWRECLRVLKPGAFACVMSAPRSDVQNAMISRLMEAGFRLDFTPIYWTYASGFPKAGNIGKLVDKRLGAERKVVSTYRVGGNALTPTKLKGGTYATNAPNSPSGELAITAPATDQAKALDGSYAGFQPKPAVEVVIVAMKPLSEKTYVDQALKNRKGITWLDDCRVPTGEKLSGGSGRVGGFAGMEDEGNKGLSEYRVQGNELGRFPANLLVSDDVLNDGTVTKSPKTYKRKADGFGQTSYGIGEAAGKESLNFGDSGSYSRYFDLDAWARERLTEQQMKTFPFAIFPKASKSEKNKGLDHLPKTHNPNTEDKPNPKRDIRPEVRTANHHPTVKPLKLMSYLITLFSREGDTVLDPFVGSGTTVVAAKMLNRKGIGIEREAEYAEIAKARLEAVDIDKQLELV